MSKPEDVRCPKCDGAMKSRQSSYGKPVLPWIDILVSVPTPGSHDGAAMLDRGRLQAIADVGACGVRFDSHYERTWAWSWPRVATDPEWPGR